MKQYEFKLLKDNKVIGEGCALADTDVGAFIEAKAMTSRFLNASGYDNSEGVEIDIPSIPEQTLVWPSTYKGRKRIL